MGEQQRWTALITEMWLTSGYEHKKDYAAVLGASDDSLTNWLNGKYSDKAEQWLKVAEVRGWSPNEMVAYMKGFMALDGTKLAETPLLDGVKPPGKFEALIYLRSAQTKTESLWEIVKETIAQLDRRMPGLLSAYSRLPCVLGDTENGTAPSDDQVMYSAQKLTALLRQYVEPNEAAIAVFTKETTRELAASVRAAILGRLTDIEVSDHELLAAIVYCLVRATNDDRLTFAWLTAQIKTPQNGGGDHLAGHTTDKPRSPKQHI